MAAGDFLAELSRWEDQDTTLSSVLHALSELRERARAAARVSVVNLVVMVADDDAAGRALAALAEMGARHPARTVVFINEPGARDAAPQLDARAVLYGSFVAGHAVCSDVIELKARGPVIDHLDSLAEPLQLADVPSAIWYFESEPDPHDALLRMADAIIVDTKELGARFALDAIAEVTDTLPVIDLSWLRLIPWRELLGNLFQGELLRGYLDNVQHVEIAGKSAPRRLLSGWLSAQLALDASMIQVEDAQHVTIELVCERDGHKGVFRVGRDDDTRIVHATVMIDDELFYEEFVGLHDHPLSYSLTQALIHLYRSNTFEHALKHGLALEEVA